MDDRDEDGGARPGVSRRGFLGTLVGGVVGTAVAGELAGAVTAAEASPSSEDGRIPLELRINGRPHRLQVEPRWTLLDVLRDKLGLVGTKLSCGRGECGACTVLIDGLARYSCMTLAVEAAGREIVTIEGLLRGEELGDLQRAFVDADGFQCGYCTPGQVMAAEGLLRRVPDPTPAQVREGMAGNLCRCGSYAHIFTAVERAAAARKGGAR